jgi:hypothetical protein
MKTRVAITGERKRKGLFEPAPVEEAQTSTDAG